MLLLSRPQPYNWYTCANPPARGVDVTTTLVNEAIMTGNSMEQSLTVIEQKEVQFYGDTIVAVRAKGSGVYVPVRPICELLGVDWSAQRRRISRDAVLSDVAMSVAVTTTDIAVDSRRPRSSELLALPLDYISGFLFGINADRVKPEVRDRLIQYQRECYRILAEAFTEGRLTADPTFDELQHADTPAAQAYRMARALMELARQQLILESRLSDHTGRLDSHETRLEQIESALGDRGRFITPEQATEISQAVKSIATALHKKSGRNEYGAVYGEFYRKFGIPSYRELPARRFDEAMRFLTDWFAELTGQQGLPF